MRSQLHVAQGGEPGSDDHAQNNQPGLFAEQHSVNREQQETEGDGEVPPGVKTSRDGQREDSGVQYSRYSVAVNLAYPRSESNFNFSYFHIAIDLGGSVEIFADGVADVRQGFLFSGTLRPTARQARTMDAEAFLGFFQRHFIAHA
jgi:hypothetical protein